MGLFGSKLAGIRDKVVGWGYCERCGKYGKLSSYSAHECRHVLRIPLKPTGPPCRIIKECPSCGYSIHVPEHELPGMLQELRDTVDLALAALTNGEKTFTPSAQHAPMDSGAYLAETVELLLALGGDIHTKHISDTLTQGGLQAELAFYNGSVFEFTGDCAKAAEDYEQAAKLSATPRPLTFLGAMYLGYGKLGEAADAYERAQALDAKDLAILVSLINVYTQQKRFDDIADVYEKCFELNSGLMHDKKTHEAYEKACEEAGRTPINVSKSRPQ